MTFTWKLFASVTCTVMTVVFYCNADSLPPPTRLSYVWLDPFTVNVSWSWEEPSNLPDGCNVNFEYRLEGKDVRRTDQKYFTDSCLTEETDSENWKYSIHATSPCEGWNESGTENATVQTQKPRAKVVQDFKCFLDPSGMNCSWTVVNRSLNLTLYYRRCGHSTEERIKSLKECDRYYTSGVRNGCFLKVADETEVCINATTVAGSMTFKPVLVLHSPKLTVNRRENNLHLSWQPLEVKSNCDWIYELCTKECGNDRLCKNITKHAAVEGHMTEMPYDENCQYDFQSRVITYKSCPLITSDFGDPVIFGVNKPPDNTLTMVAIIIPIILSVSVILSCYCFRRHSAIICPVIPDPSAIFKEMLNGNKELKPSTRNLYTPEPESTESCKLTLSKENCDSQQIL